MYYLDCPFCKERLYRGNYFNHCKFCDYHANKNEAFFDFNGQKYCAFIRNTSVHYCATNKEFCLLDNVPPEFFDDIENNMKKYIVFL